MNGNMDELHFISRVCSWVLTVIISLLFMWKLITLHVGIGAAFLASLALYIACSFLTFTFEKSLLWENYLKEVEKEIREMEEHRHLVENYWERYLFLKE